MAETGIAAGRGWFADGRSATNHDVAIAIENGLIVLSGNAGSWHWPVTSVRLRPSESTNDRPVLCSTATPDARLRLADDTLVPALADACPALYDLTRPTRRAYGIIAASIVGAVTLITLVYFGLPPLAAAFAKRVPEPWEARIGEQVETSFYTFLQAAPCLELSPDDGLEHLTARLTAGAGLARQPEIIIVRSAVINAFALPGNRIIVTTGMLTFLENGDELAGVLAHEVGHLQHHDPLALLIDETGWQMLATAIFGLSTTGSLGASFASLSYSREIEARADRSGVATLAAAGIDSRGFARAMRRFATLGAEFAPYLSNHPPSLVRAEAIEASGAKGGPAISPAEWHRLRVAGDTCILAPKTVLVPKAAPK